MRQLRKKGLDPFDAGVQYAHKEELRRSFPERIHRAIKKARPACLVCPHNQGTFYGLARRAPLVDYSSQEALFTDAAHYGYHYSLVSRKDSTPRLTLRSPSVASIP